MSGPPITRHERARSTIDKCLWIGVGLLILGAVVAGAAWPGTEITITATEDTGSAAVAPAGLLVAGVGQMVLLVALIAIGVRLGTEAVSPRA